ncbi:hypothetical protein V8C43DRAFT_284507 [Trichoderma afarasin]
MRKQGKTKHLLYRYVSAHIPPPPKAGRKANPRPNAWFPLQIASCRCSAFSSSYLSRIAHSRRSNQGPAILTLCGPIFRSQPDISLKTTQIKKDRPVSSLFVTAPLLSIQSALVITLHIKGSN